MIKRATICYECQPASNFYCNNPERCEPECGLDRFDTYISLKDLTAYLKERIEWNLKEIKEIGKATNEDKLLLMLPSGQVLALQSILSEIEGKE